MEQKTRAVAEIVHRIPRTERHRDRAQAEVDQATTEVAQSEQEHTDFGTPEDLTKRRQEVSDELKHNDREIARLERDIKSMNVEMTEWKKVIERCEEDITREMAKLAAKEAGRQQELEDRLQAAYTALKGAEEEMRAIQERQAEHRRETDQIKLEGQRAGDEVTSLRQQLDDLRTTIDRAQRSQTHPLAAYGEGMGQALDNIKSARWHGDVPLGPFGLHVKIRDQRWANVIRSRLGPSMFSFLVTDARDRVQLKRILDSCRW
jgi:chromosome segregation ATPase